MLDSMETESESCVWKLANVKANRDPESKGRPLSRKQKDWRLKVPFGMHSRVFLYLEYWNFTDWVVLKNSRWADKVVFCVSWWNDPVQNADFVRRSHSLQFIGMLIPNFGAICKPLSFFFYLFFCCWWVVGRNFGLGSMVDGPAQSANVIQRNYGVHAKSHFNPNTFLKAQGNGVHLTP